MQNDWQSTGDDDHVLTALEQPKVLCIDDDPEITRCIKLRLKNYQVSVICAYHGMHGFWLAMTEKPDLIITDINMPQGKGDYIVECLKRNTETANIPILVLSGVADAASKNQMKSLGVDHYYTKPCSVAELLKGVESFIPLQPVNQA